MATDLDEHGERDGTWTRRPETPPSKGDSTRLRLTLYVAGTSPCSARAIMNLRAFCETNLVGRYELEIIDIYQQPALAEQADLLAIPVLIKRTPRPERRFIGDLSDTRRLLAGLAVE